MTKEEKIQYAVSLLQESGVDFRLGNVRFENTKTDNPALEQSAKQFNAVLLDEQAKKIEAYKKQFAHLSKVLHGKNQKIEELKKKTSKYSNKLADACVELRELKEKLANIAINNVNAQALKSAENALKEKDEVIDDLSKEIKHLYDMVHGDPILNMMDKKKEGDKNHLPVEDNPEEVEIKDALQTIKKAMEDGHTVVIDYDNTVDIINSYL